MISDLRFALRQLIRNPVVSLIAILSLTLGIGATTSVFSIINGTLIQSVPYAEPERLVFVTLEKTEGGNSNMSIGGKQFWEWEKESQSFAGLAAYEWMFTYLVHPDGNESVEGMRASAALFRVLGVPAVLGRTFTAEERLGPDHPVMLLGYEFWQHRFGGDPGIIGRQIQLNRLPPLTVVGIMPPRMRFLPSRGGAREPNYNLHATVDFWIPSSPLPAEEGGSWNVVARLRPGIPLSSARAEMQTIAAAQALANPKLNGVTAAVTPARQVLDGDVRKVVLPLFGAVCLVLLVAIANVAGLLLVRGLGRQKELAVRAALGAGWRRLLRLTLVESLLLALIGGLLGVGFAFAATKVLLWVAPDSIPRLEEVVVDRRVLLFSVGVSLLAGLSSGLLAMGQVLRVDLSSALKAGERGGKSSPAARRLLGGLVAGEVALTLVLLVGAGLLLQTTVRLTRLNPGYETHEIVTMVVTSLQPNIFEFHREALQKISALPGVSSAAFVWGLPLTGNSWQAPLAIEGRPAPASPRDWPFLPLRSVTPDYFKLMGVALQRGRLFDDRDRDGAPAVAIINEEMARRHFPGENPIGKYLKMPQGKPMEIVGLVGDLRNQALTAPVEAEVYLSFFQSPAFSKHLALRTSGDPLGVAVAAKRALQQIDPGAVVEKVKTMDRIRNDSVSAQRFAMSLISAFAFLALGLAIAGIYGVMSYAVVQRSHEIGVRLALGAQRHHVAQLILRQGLAMVLAGLAMGLAGAAAVTRVLQSLLFEVTATDWLTFGAVSFLLAGVTLLACWWPARRATKIDPIVVLRNE